MTKLILRSTLGFFKRFSKCHIWSSSQLLREYQGGQIHSLLPLHLPPYIPSRVLRTCISFVARPCRITSAYLFSANYRNSHTQRISINMTRRSFCILPPPPLTPFLVHVLHVYKYFPKRAPKVRVGAPAGKFKSYVLMQIFGIRSIDCLSFRNLNMVFGMY